MVQTLTRTLRGPKEKFNLLKVPKYAIIHNIMQASRDLERCMVELVRDLTKGILYMYIVND